MFLGIMITASATSVLTVSTIEGKGAKISSFNDLANRKVCAESNTAPYNFLKSQKQVQLNVIEGIKNNRDMFWRFEQFGSDGRLDFTASRSTHTHTHTHTHSLSLSLSHTHTFTHTRTHTHTQHTQQTPDWVPREALDPGRVHTVAGGPVAE